MVDLHTHSYYSDGTFSPAELVAQAEEIGLTALALCDHNTVAGLPEFLTAGANSPVQTVPGIECSTEYRGRELHILGLFLPEKHFPAVTARMAELLREKERSNRLLVDRLNRAGYSLDYDRLKQTAKGGYVNRAVIAAEMTRLGYTASIREAFAGCLSESRGFYVPPRRPDAYETIRYLKSLGAVAVLAHPFLDLDAQELEAFLPGAVDAGLDGMETCYPRFTPAQTQAAAAIARRFGLLPSGGSDFHGGNKPDIRLGTGTGSLRVPEEFLSGLKNRKKVCKIPEKFMQFVDFSQQ